MNKELEETICTARKTVDLRVPVLNRATSYDGEQFPGNNVNDDTQQSRCLGGFLGNVKLAWMSHGPRLVIVDVKSGETVSFWTFRENITSVCPFPTHSGSSPLLLIGLDNGANRIKDSFGTVCVYDCSSSKILRAIHMPVGVEQVCIVNGGSEWEDASDRRVNNIFGEFCGLACVVLRNLRYIMLDLQRPLWDNVDQYELMDESCPASVNFLPISALKQSPAELPYIEGKHIGCDMINCNIERYIGFSRDEFESSVLYDEKLTTVTVSSPKIGCLISGCLGRFIIWQSDGTVGHISMPIDENMCVTHLALLEPTDDPRPFCYLWVVYQDETGKHPPLLRMHAMLFASKNCDKGSNVYYNLDSEPSVKFEFELDEGERVVSIEAIVREINPDQTDSGCRRGEDSLLLVNADTRTLLFDLNQWYKEQMPRTVGELQNPNTIIASYRTRMIADEYDREDLISCAYAPLSLREFSSESPNTSEELFYPNSLSLEWLEMNSRSITFWHTRGVQSELLREIALAGPDVFLNPTDTFHRCLTTGLVPYNTECSFDSSVDVQKQMLLSLCLEQQWVTFLVQCAQEWADGRASLSFPFFRKWSMQRAFAIKTDADQLCVPLFDQSGNNIGDAEVKLLRFCAQQLECVSQVISKLPIATEDVVVQYRALRRVTMYLQLVLWFYDVGLLPETQEMDETNLPVSLTISIPYPMEKLAAYYSEKRGQADSSDCLFIDEFVTRECPSLMAQWELESGDVAVKGLYPPPSLQSLLRSYLLESDKSEAEEMEVKHQVTLYFLLDLTKQLQNYCPRVDQLIKYPAAFKLSPSVIKLTQAFWALDDQDYQGFLDMMTGQLVADSDIKDWHHKFAIQTLLRHNQHKLALTYLKIRKPPLSSIQEQSTYIGLSVEHGLVQSAFHSIPPSSYEQLLDAFFRTCKSCGKLTDVLHLALNREEEDAFLKFLEKDKSEETKVLYYLLRCRYLDASNAIGLTNNRFSQSQRNVPPTLAKMLSTYDSTLPRVARNFTLDTLKKSLDADFSSRYPRPMSHYKSQSKVLKMHELALKKAKETCLRNDSSHIPFFSVPGSSYMPFRSVNNSDRVIFPALAKSPTAKRSFNEMCDDDNDRTSNARKRRKLVDGDYTLDRAGNRELGISIAILDTPLIRRKKKLGGSDERSETPQSILKNRLFVRPAPSCSPGGSSSFVVEPMEDEEEVAAETRPARQIRFSVGTNLQESPQGQESGRESAMSSNKAEESCNEEVYYSPNGSNRSLHNSTILSGNTSASVMTGPRPRRSLQRKNESSSFNEASGQSSFDSSITEFSPNSSPRKNLLLHLTPLPTETILDPNTSYEDSPIIRIKPSQEQVQSTPLVGKSNNNYSQQQKDSTLVVEESGGESVERQNESSSSDVEMNHEECDYSEGNNNSSHSKDCQTMEGEESIINAEENHNLPYYEPNEDFSNQQFNITEDNSNSMPSSDIQEIEQEPVVVHLDDNSNSNTPLFVQEGSNSADYRCTETPDSLAFESLEEVVATEQQQQQQKEYRLNEEIITIEELAAADGNEEIVVESHSTEEIQVLEQKIVIEEVTSYHEMEKVESGIVMDRGSDESLVLMIDSETFADAYSTYTDDFNQAIMMDSDYTGQVMIDSGEGGGNASVITEEFRNEIIESLVGNETTVPRVTEITFEQQTQRATEQIEPMKSDQVEAPMVDDDAPSEDVILSKEEEVVVVHSPRQKKNKKGKNTEVIDEKPPPLSPKEKQSVNIESVNRETTEKTHHREDKKSKKKREIIAEVAAESAIAQEELSKKQEEIITQESPKRRRGRPAKSKERAAAEGASEASKSEPVNSKVEESPTSESRKRKRKISDPGPSNVEQPGKQQEELLMETMEEEKSAEVPVRRSSRRAASVNKDVEQQPAKKITRGRKASTSSRNTRGSSVVSETSESTDAGEPLPSISQDIPVETLPRRGRARAASVTKETESESEEGTRTTRRRCASVPKEMTEQLPVLKRSKRANSVAKETSLPDNNNRSLRSRQLTKITEETPRSPAANTRSRRSSILPTVEEVEDDVFDAEEKSSPVSERTTRENSRTRRGQSVESEVSSEPATTKSRKGSRKKIMEEPIFEDPNEAIPPEQPKKPVGRPRKRTTSTASVNEEDYSISTRTRSGSTSQHRSKVKEPSEEMVTTELATEKIKETSEENPPLLRLSAPLGPRKIFDMNSKLYNNKKKENH